MAAAKLAQRGGTFSRNAVREELGLTRQQWDSGYTAIFQGMRSDHPGGAPPVGARFESVFRRVERGEYVLTLYGQRIARELS